MSKHELLLLILSLILAALLWRAQRQRRALADLLARRRAPGVGAALAHALEGDWAGAEAILKAVIKEGADDPVDAYIALIAVIRASGHPERAARITAQLAQGGAPWALALKLRTALDMGQLEAALEQLDGAPDELAIAALCRADRWAEAYERARQVKPRQPAREAALLAGLALTKARVGDERAASAAIKEAARLDPEGLLPCVAAARLHPKPTERQRAHALLLERWPALQEAHPSEGTPRPDAVDPLISAAHALKAEGRGEEALGRLRDHLDEEPRAWRARRLYDEWLLASGTPEDWRAELFELLALFPRDDAIEGRPTCTRCGFWSDVVFFICPRCDAFGQLQIRPLSPGVTTHALDGAKLSDLLKGL
ncbi:hypothetical protein KKF91_11110 [Myxococcota bacterium]|nr:hypothetical protein [Myxococcota bacterium]MBU1431077.1 hypothetical protein [Myxococcota bacterium]MBU1896521.1 hypothetical protein [Myxococcota bacterium]